MPRPRGETSRLVTTVKEIFRSAVLVPIGRRTGAPQVQLTSAPIRGGNFLYYWLWAGSRRHGQQRRVVLWQDAMADWIDEFPALREITAKKDELPFLRSEWINSHRHTYGVDFDETQLSSFIARYLLTSVSFSERVERARSWLTPETVVINVRRGDYYQYPHLTEVYGLDIASFVRQALSRCERAAGRYVVVSDGLGWCTEHLSDCLPGELETVSWRRDMFDDLAVLAAAPTLLLANSTFSYWGAYIARAIDPGAEVLAPPYHYRENGVLVRDTYAPAWNVVDGHEGGGQ